MSINKKTYNTMAILFSGDCLFKAKIGRYNLVFKKLNLCPVMPASRGVNPLATEMEKHTNVQTMFV